MRVLLVKMSSLGDVVHTLAAVSDAASQNSSLRFDWVVEEAYQEIPRWHRAVERIIPVALRRWRKSPLKAIRGQEWSAFRRELRQREYDLVLDAQGLLKSGWIAWQTRGPRSGRDRKSAREPLAALFYEQRYRIDLSLPEVEQLRQLFAMALGYPQPTEPAQFSIELPRKRLAGEYAVLAHGAAWPNKLWPVEHWRTVAEHLSGLGMQVRLPWGNELEKERAQEIAASCGGVVLPPGGVAEAAAELAGARLVVGLDTGLTHIAVAARTPTVTLYGPSVPVYGELAARNVIHLSSSDSKIVDTARKNTVPVEAVLAAIERLAVNAPKAPV